MGKASLVEQAMEQLPRQQRGELMLQLWAFAVVMTASNAVLIGSLVRVGWRVARCADRRPVPMARAAWSPALGVTAGVLVAQRLGTAAMQRRIVSWVEPRLSEANAPGAEG